MSRLYIAPAGSSPESGGGGWRSAGYVTDVNIDTTVPFTPDREYRTPEPVEISASLWPEDSAAGYVEASAGGTAVTLQGGSPYVALLFEQTDRRLRLPRVYRSWPGAGETRRKSAGRRRVDTARRRVWRRADRRRRQAGQSVWVEARVRVYFPHTELDPPTWYKNAALVGFSARAYPAPRL